MSKLAKSTWTFVTAILLTAGLCQVVQAQSWTGGNQSRTLTVTGWTEVRWVTNTAYNAANDPVTNAAATDTKIGRDAAGNYRYIGYDAWGQTYTSYPQGGAGNNWLYDPSPTVGNGASGAVVFDTATTNYRQNNINLETNRSVTSITVRQSSWNFYGGSLTSSGSMSLGATGSGAITFANTLSVLSTNITNSWNLSGGTFNLGPISMTGSGSLSLDGTVTTVASGMAALLGAQGMNVGTSTSSVGSWSFSGSNINTATVGGLGKLTINSTGTVGITNQLFFGGGVDWYNGVISHVYISPMISENPFGTYVYATNDTRSLVKVFGQVRIYTPQDYDSQFGSRFELEPGRSVELNAAQGKTITFTGVNTVNSTKGGGVFYIPAGSRVFHTYSENMANREGTIAFTNNYAENGAAIYAVQDYEITGLARFSGNLAKQDGGAVYMQGARESNTLKIDTSQGPIVFQNNRSGVTFTGTTPTPGTGDDNAIHLYQNITVNILGDRYLYMDDGFSSSSLGGNVMNIDITDKGFVQFGENSRSMFTESGTPGGVVNLNSGIFRIVGNNTDEGEFSTLGGEAAFNVKNGATVAGGGIIAAGGEFFFGADSIIAPDSIRYLVPATLDNTGTTAIESGNWIGKLTFKGNVNMASTVINVDTDYNATNALNTDYKSSDTIIIKRLDIDDGKTTGKLLVDSGVRNTINVTNWASGRTDATFLLAGVEGGIFDQDGVALTNENVMDYFTIRSSGGGALTGRRGASLFVRTGLVTGLDPATEKDLVLHTSDKANLYLYWNGTQSEVWNQQENLLNWYRRGSAADMAAMRNTGFNDTVEQAFFMTGDYVYFTAEAKEDTVETKITSSSDIVVSGMEILGGEYHFVGETIYGQLSSRPLEAPATDPDSPFVGVVATAILKIDNAWAAFDMETKFDGGTVLSNGAAVVLRNKRAATDPNYPGYNMSLGAYDTAYNQADGSIERGVVKVTEGAASVGTEIDQKVMLHFEILDGATLTFDLADNSTFTIDGVITHDAGILIHRGGAVNLADQGKYEVAGNNVTLVFSNNEALEGGAIYAPRDLTITGNTAFLNNVALDNGGAIYMNGAGYQTLTFDTGIGNIVFDGNTAGGASNSIYLYKNIDMAFKGGNNVLFNDAINAGSIGYNRLSSGADFTGIAQFRGVNTFNNDGPSLGSENKIELLGGTFRLAGDVATELNLGGNANSAFTLGRNAMIAGQGQITMYAASKGFLIQGALSPDADTFTSKLVPGRQDRFQVAETANIGQLSFVGNMRLDSATLVVDLKTETVPIPQNVNDQVLVTGKITLDRTLGLNTVLTTAELGTSGDFMILQASEGIVGANNAEIASELLKYFNGSNQLGARQRGDLEFRKGAGSTATTLFDELWLTNVQSGMNAKIYWTGAYTETDPTNPLVVYGLWDLNTTLNWTSTGQDELKFLDYDYVLFDDSKRANGIIVNNYHAKLTGQDMTVVGMDIVSGNYDITNETGQARRIIGRMINPGVNDPYLPFDEQTGQLRILGGSIRLGVATDFYAGTYLENGTVYLAETTAGTPGSSASLGVYNHADYSAYDPTDTVLAGSRQGYVEVGGTGTVAYDTGTVPTTESEMTATNRYKVLANGNLRFDIAENHTLFTRGIDVTAGTVDNNGAVIFLEAGGRLDFIGDGTFHFGAVGNANVAVNGGVIHAAGDLAFGGNTIFEGNRATTAGGAVFTVGELTLNGNATFKTNLALRGGALYARDVTMTNTAQTALFLGNTATDGGAIYATDSITINGDVNFGIDLSDPDNPVYGANTATNSGGAVYLANADADITVNGGTVNFYGNTAATGGAIYGNDVTLTVTGADTDVLFEGNTATDGGAIYIADAITINGDVDFGTVDRTNPNNPAYSGNTATNAGGAVYFANVNAYAAIDAGTVNFYGNTALTGGAFYAANDFIFTVTGADTDVLFEGNTATDGGAIYVGSDLTLSATDGLLRFERNSANDGGAIYVTDSITINGDANFGRADLTNPNNPVVSGGNTATNSGGAVYSARDVNISGANTNTVFADNTATNWGGAVYAGRNVIITAGSANTIDSATNFVANRAVLGGAIYALGGVRISGASTTANFQGNEATGNYGGAIYTTGHLTIGGAAVDFIANRALGAAGAGGAVYVTPGDGKQITIGANTRFLDNTAVQSGGAIALGGGTGILSKQELTLDADGGDIIFDNNTAADGGAIHTGDWIDVTMEGDSQIFFGSTDSLRFGTRLVENNSALELKETVKVIMTAQENSFNIGNMNVGADAEFFLQNGSTFSVSNGTFTLAGTLSGSGILDNTGGNGIVINGILNPNSDRYTYDRDNKSIVQTTGAIGTLTLGGDVLMSGAELKIDLQETNVSDLVKITGDLSTDSNSTIVVTFATGFHAGVFDIITAGNELYDVLENFEIDSSMFGERNKAALRIKRTDDDPETPADKTIQLVTGSSGNLKLYWTGDDGMNGISDQNWYAHNSLVSNWIVAADTSRPQPFLNGDYVVFTDAAYVLGGQPQTITVKSHMNENDAVDVIVAGMEILGGDYTFNATAGNSRIVGDPNEGLYISETAQSGDKIGMLWISGTDTSATFNLKVKFSDDIVVTDGATVTFNENIETGRNVKVNGGANATFNGVSTLTRGAILNNATVTLGNDKALDDYSEFIAGTNQRGVVDINGNVTVTGSRDLELKNYFTLQDASTLTFELDGTSLTLDNVGGIDLSVGNAALVVNTVDTDDRFVFNGLVTAGTAGAGNSFTKLGEGTVVFNGGTHNFNTVAGTDNGFHVREGETRLVNSTVNSADSVFQFDAGTVLTGSGTLNAGTNGTITLQGDIAADSGDIDGNGSDIGQLAFTGRVILDGATINVNMDLQQTGTADLLSVTGSVGFGSNNTSVDVNIVGNWIADEYLIVETTEMFDGLDERDILAHFNLTYNNEQLSSRQEATLSVKNDLKDLYLTLHDAKNLQLIWNGVSSSDVWNTSLKNWLTTDGEAINFLDGDTVIFTDTARQKDVEIAGNWLVGGMEIQSGSYTFSGKKITGGISLSNDATIATGRLDILTDGTVTINNEMAFENGILISGNTTIVLGNDKALGELDRAGKNNDEGTVHVLGENVTIRTDGQADHNVRNQLLVASGSSLTVEAVAGTKLTFRNVSDSRAISASGDVTILGNVDFADNLGAVAMIGANLTLAPNATFTNNRGLSDGGAIVGYADATVSVFGNTLFEGNRAGSDLLDGKGGAIFMDGGTLNLNTAAGDIVFRNNVATSGGSTYTNAIHLEDGAELNIVGQKDVYFYDALSAASTGSANHINIAMGGTRTVTEPGTVHFFGNSVLNNTVFSHDGGRLRLEEGASLSAENSFTMATGAQLFGNGMIASTSISLSGDISADGFDRDGDGNAIGEIRLDGDTVVKGVNLIVDLGDASASDRLSVDGTATFVNSNEVSLNNWKAGKFNLILATDGIIGSKDNWGIKDGDLLSKRQEWSFDVVNVQQSQALQLTTVTRNDVLTWTNAAETMIWDSHEKNWEGTIVKDENGKYLDSFLELDYVVFSGLGNGEIDVKSDVLTGGMLISAGQYVFDGGSLGGRAVVGSDFQDGVLTVRGGQSAFYNDVYFENGIHISGADTLVAIDQTGKMWTDRLFLVDTGATLVFTAAEDIIKGGDVVLKGDVVTFRPELTKGRASIKNVIEMYDAPIDQDTFNAIFDGKTQGLYGQFTAYSPDGMKMDLNYRPVTVWEFSESNKLSWNMNEVSKGLSDVFNDAMIRQEFCELRDCMYGEDMTNADVIAILDTMRGTEMGAAALEIALWSPWRTVFNHLSQDQALQPAPAFGNVRGQVGTQQASTRDFWIEAFHRTTEASTDVKTSGYTIARTGTIMGLDKKLDMYTTIGAALNYNTPQLTSRYGKIEATDWGLALYAKRYITEEIYLNSYIGFGHQEYKYQRHEFGQTHKTRYDGNSLYASTELVRPVIWRSGGTLLPLIALDFQKSWAGDFVESDLAYAKRVTDGELESSMVRFGLNSRWLLHERVSLDTRFQYSYKFSGDSDGRVNATFANAPAGGYQMNLRGVELGRDFLNVGIGGQTYLNSCRTLHLFGDYDYDIGYKSYSHTAQLGFVYQW